MLYTSQDLLYVVLAFCVLWLTIFLSWSLYYVAMLLRGGYQMFKEFRSKLEAFDRFVALVTDKLERTSGSLQLLVEGVSKLAAFLIERKATARKRKSA